MRSIEADPVSVSAPVTGAMPPPPAAYDPADYIGGDPVMGGIGVGHDPADTMAAQAAVDAAVSANGGKALTPEQQAQVLAKFPGADTSIAAGPAAVRTTLKAVGDWLVSAWGWVKWTLLGLLGLLLLLLALSVYFRVTGQ